MQKRPQTWVVESYVSMADPGLVLEEYGFGDGIVQISFWNPFKFISILIYISDQGKETETTFHKHSTEAN